MGLLEKIEALRKKPEAERERVVLMLAAGITLLLFLFWVFDFSMNAGLGGEETPAEAAPSPIGILENNVKALIQEAKDQF